MFLLLLTQAALAQNPAAVTHPKGVPLPLFYPDDYPSEARRRGWEGSVVADLTISVAGRVTKCEIVKSSRHSLLDSTTCRILIQRAKFYPARDKDGNAVEDVVRTPEIFWADR